MFVRYATLHKLGDVTRATAGIILSIYERRWGVELTIKELKSGLHLGWMQVTNDKERVTHSITMSILAYILLARLYGSDEAMMQDWSLFQLKERFIVKVAQDAVRRTERKW